MSPVASSPVPPAPADRPRAGRLSVRRIFTNADGQPDCVEVVVQDAAPAPTPAAARVAALRLPIADFGALVFTMRPKRRAGVRVRGVLDETHGNPRQADGGAGCYDLPRTGLVSLDANVLGSADPDGRVVGLIVQVEAPSWGRHALDVTVDAEALMRAVLGEADVPCTYELGHLGMV